jgi:DNA-binding MarR family transcriptional regulator
MQDPARQVALNDAIELMHFGYRAMVAKADRVLATRGLSRVHHRILYFVARLPGRGVNELLRTLGVSKQALNGPLRDLYAQQLIAFERGALDARVKRLVLTPAGRRLEGRLSALQRRQWEAVFGAAGPDAEQGWRAAMAVLAAPELARAGRKLPGVLSQKFA